MNFVLIYFSGTGNTELITGEISRRLEKNGHSVSMISVEDIPRIRRLDPDGSILGFGFPVYKFSYPDILRNLLPLLNGNAGGRRCFLYSTYARFPGKAMELFRRKLKRTGFHVYDAASFKAPSCGISARKPPDDDEHRSVMFFENGIDTKLDEFADRLSTNSRCMQIWKPRPVSPLEPLKLAIVRDVERTKYPRLRISDTHCTSCGLCVARCPENNLEMKGGIVVVRDDSDCLHCLRCINRCPGNAFTFGSLTTGTNQYRLSDRDALFDAAVSGDGNPYWNDFSRVVAEWRRRTVRYWLSHRKSPEI